MAALALDIELAAESQAPSMLWKGVPRECLQMLDLSGLRRLVPSSDEPVDAVVLR